MLNISGYKKLQRIFILSLIILVGNGLFAQEILHGHLVSWYLKGPQEDWNQRDFNDYYNWQEEVYHSMAKKMSGDPQLVRRQKTIMNGNKITTEIWNYGSISSPGNRTTDIIWEKLGYGYEFGPLIVAEVEVPKGSHRDVYMKRDEQGNPITNADGDTLYGAWVITDGLVSLDGEVSPDGKDRWGFDPLAWNDDFTVPYADPVSDRMPNSNDRDQDGDGRPDGWPAGWYNENLKTYVWPGALRQGSTNADLEVLCVVDDRNNKEFEYYPFSDDLSRKGLGIEVECRYYQWANPLAEDIIFLVYKVTNKSDQDLHNVTFGMWGDPHIGGPSNYIDDLSFFDRGINMVYAWDADGLSDVVGRYPGYFGYKFLESPGDPHDGIDNDEDGLVDESRENGIDDDGDWDSEKDDVGIDGLPNTGDEGEDDGLPTAGDPFDIRKPGEPNFEWTDLDESDMIGLTSFAAPTFGQNNVISNDHFIYTNFLTPGRFDSLNADTPGDNIFLYGSGTFELKSKESRRFSIALLIGQNFADLTLNAITAQDIYESNYQFAKPPEKPIVTAVPGDRKVTLYWDDIAESSWDPIADAYDFEGYAIYRSTDPNFLDQQTITDANGSRFLFEPLKTILGASAKFDLENEYIGLSDIPYTGRGMFYNLGNNTGIVHSFIDSNNVVNGQIYYYAVVSYDHGDMALNVAPTECSKAITVNPETNEIFLDVNTVRVIPRTKAAGYVEGGIVEEEIVEHFAGIATGNIWIEYLDPRAYEENNLFEITFQENPTGYSIEDQKPITQLIKVDYNVHYPLRHKHINPNNYTVTRINGDSLVPGQDFLFFPENGQLLIPDTLNSVVENGDSLIMAYTFYPIFESSNLNEYILESGVTAYESESNPVFDGMKLYVIDDPLEMDISKTGWSTSSFSNYLHSVGPHQDNDDYKYPADYEIIFYDEVVDTGVIGVTTKFEIYEVTNNMIAVQKRFGVTEIMVDGEWTAGDQVTIMEPDENGIYALPEGKFNPLWEFTFVSPADTVGIAPGAGDRFYIGTKRPFTSSDVYQFTTRASAIDEAKLSNDLDNIYVVPNPYVVTNQLEQLDLQKPRDRGPRRLYFNNLPAVCTIRIYTVNGELVDILEHNSSIDDGKEFWDLTTRDNFPIAFGMYLYHVDAGKLGEKIGRFAVIK